MPKFFINHPIFAWVVSILISLAGVIAILNLGVESYPSIAPPQVTVSATYPGASAETTERSVTQVIEQQLTGIDNLLYPMLVGRRLKMHTLLAFVSIVGLTAARILSETISGVRRARETVMAPTPASWATSLRVTRPVLRRFFASDIPSLPRHTGAHFKAKVRH